MVSRDASIALMLLGFEAPPSSAGVPLQLRFDLVKRGPAVDLSGVTGSIAENNVSGGAHFDFGGAKTRFALSADANAISLPSLLGVLVAWQRTPSTEEMPGAIGAGAAEVWPLRGFSLSPIEKPEGTIALKANTLALGSAVKVQNASVSAAVGKDGLSITDFKGALFGGEFAASGKLSPRGTGAELSAHADLKGGKLEDLAKSIAGSALAKGPFDLDFDVQGEGLSPPGLVAGLSGHGTFSLGAGTLQALSPDPLRRVAATAANKTIKADKDEIAAEAKSVQEKITKGIYKFAPAQFAFDITNGTLRLAPSTLAGSGAEIKINGYLELASLKLDSEWAVRLAGAGNDDVPPVSLVFTGVLNKAAEITPAVDTAAIEAYLTMRRMQEGVEQLETLDVSGRTPPAADTGPEDQTSAVPEQPVEPEQEAAPLPEPTPPQEQKPTAETESPGQAIPPSAPSAKAMPSASELLQEAEEKETETAKPAPASVEQKTPASPAASPGAEAAAEPAPPTPEAQTAPAAVEGEPAPKPRSAGKSRRQRPSVKREAPDDWKKGIGIFGGG